MFGATWKGNFARLPFDTRDLSLVVIDTGVHRELAASGYNERRRQCEEAVQILRKHIEQSMPGNNTESTICSLRDIAQEQFERFGLHLPDVLQRRVSFVLAENARVLEALNCLNKDHLRRLVPYYGHHTLVYAMTMR